MSNDWSQWIGREEVRRETAPRDPFRRLAGLLDRPEGSDDPDHLPPLGHWLCFLPDAPQADLGADGHPQRGGFMPPIELPMRMWAGSRIEFLAPIPFGAEVTRRSTIVSIAEKAGRQGPLAFISVRNEFEAGGAVCVSELLDAVYRDRAPGGAPGPGEVRQAEHSRTIIPTTPMLFRFSALTYNAHKIHYDREYTREVEGYPGLLVHGPLLATLLMDHFRRTRPNAAPRLFQVRAQRPVFDIAPFTVNLAGAGPKADDVWAAGPDGFVAMSARVEWAD